MEEQKRLQILQDLFRGKNSDVGDHITSAVHGFYHMLQHLASLFKGKKIRLSGAAAYIKTADTFCKAAVYNFLNHFRVDPALLIEGRDQCRVDTFELFHSLVLFKPRSIFMIAHAHKNAFFYFFLH